MEVDTEPQVEEPVEEVSQGDVSEQPEQSTEEQRVPVSAVQKERRRRQEADAQRQRAEIELQYLKEQYAQQNAPQEEDDSNYETTTRGELKQTVEQTKLQIAREIREENWMNNNPEKFEYVKENLVEFLKQRPNLTSAVKDAPNRYQEAFLLMNALTEKQKQELKPQVPKKQAPGSPSSIPKAAAMNQAVDVMSMSDSEYRQWRASKRRR